MTFSLLNVPLNGIFIYFSAEVSMFQRPILLEVCKIHWYALIGKQVNIFLLDIFTHARLNVDRDLSKLPIPLFCINVIQCRCLSINACWSFCINILLNRCHIYIISCKVSEQFVRVAISENIPNQVPIIKASNILIIPTLKTTLKTTWFWSDRNRMHSLQ